MRVGDRTVDQMVQAARSGKQNIAEGYVDGVTSKEMMIKLVNVNRASLHELRLDYEDYLRVRDLEQWGYDDPRCPLNMAASRRKCTAPARSTAAMAARTKAGDIMRRAAAVG